MAHCHCDEGDGHGQVLERGEIITQSGILAGRKLTNFTKMQNFYSNYHTHD